MKLFLLPLMMSLSTLANSESFVIYDSTLVLEHGCNLTVVNNSKKTNVKLALKNPSNCSFIKHSRTNIPHLMRIKNNYIILIESVITKDNSCKSEYTAISISPDGLVVASNKSKTSGSCNIGREEKVFEYFAHKIKSQK